MKITLAILSLAALLFVWTVYRAKIGSQCILDQLADSGPRGLTGLDLVERSGGKLRRGTVYVLLGRLEDSGHVEWRYVGTRRVYWLRKPLTTGESK